MGLAGEWGLENYSPQAKSNTIHHRICATCEARMFFTFFEWLKIPKEYFLTCENCMKDRF